MFTGIIYQILHVDSGRSYIGQTVDPLSERKRKHLRKAFYKNKQNNLCKALRDFGANRFEFTQIDYAEAETKERLQEILDEKEKFYIQKYDSIENGFNTRPGGQGYTEREELSPEEKAKKEQEQYLRYRTHRKEYYEKNKEEILENRKLPENRQKMYDRREKRYQEDPSKKEHHNIVHSEYMKTHREEHNARIKRRMSDPVYRQNKRVKEREKRNIAQRIRRAKKKLEAINNA